MKNRGSLARKICKWGFNEPKKNMRACNEKQVGKELITNVLYLINEMEFSIYKFLTSATPVD